MRLLLESAGYEVAVARNGREGLQRVQVAPPDFIIADVVMPEMDGYAFCQAVKTAPATQRLPFVLLTDRRAPAEKSNAELRQLALALEDRVAQRTAELREANEPLQRELEERKRAEEALQQKDEELRLISQQLWQAAKLATMGELAASIAHELNNPLATVSLRVEALLAHVLAPDPRRRALEVIEQEVERMGNLVANLLQCSRRGYPQITATDIREEIEHTLALVHYHLRNHRITAVREYASDVPLIPADHQQLRQVFLNLLTNASDAMPQGGTLTLRVTGEHSIQARRLS